MKKYVKSALLRVRTRYVGLQFFVYKNIIFTQMCTHTEITDIALCLYDSRYRAAEEKMWFSVSVRVRDL